MSFTVPAGQIVGIVGPSGSGKSTLAKLVQRLYVPESGRVLVDGVDLAMVDAGLAAPPDRRRAAGERAVQPLDPRQHRAGRSGACRSSGSSRRRSSPAPTISSWSCPRATTPSSASAAAALGRPAPAHRDRAGARHQSAHPDLRRGDERARLRERAHHPAEHERRSPSGRTVFIIAHRLSTVRRADRIITIDHGRLVEDGTHDELITTAGAMRRCIACRRESMKSAKTSIRRSGHGRSSPPGATRDELAFLPAALEIVETPPSPARPRDRRHDHRDLLPGARLGLASAQVDIVATAQGKIVPSGRTKIDSAVRDRCHSRNPRAGRAARSRPAIS